MTNLQKVIILRNRCRAALASGDQAETYRLNAIADRVYERLTPIEAMAYIDWAQGRVTTEVIDQYLHLDEESYD